MWVPHRRPTLQDVPPRAPRRGPREVATSALELGCVVLAVVLGCAVAVALVVLLLSLAAPLGALLLTWIAWRSDRELRGARARLRSRWGRSAQVIRGGLDELWQQAGATIGPVHDAKEKR